MCRYEEDYLMLSGLQHFLFCRRQWALIHVEQVWSENELTVDGRLFHERVHSECAVEKRGPVIIVRNLRVKSRELGISGICDVVEFHQASDGITLDKIEGSWNVVPIEYKRGSKDFQEADAAQLCAEAICLEEMLCCNIEYGYLFWGETHRREKIELGPELRKKVQTSLEEMHQYMKRGYTPKVKRKKGCGKCSLKNLCLPEMTKVQSVKSYIQDHMGAAE